MLRSMKDRMLGTIERMEQIVGSIVVTKRGAMSALLDTRDIAREEQAWIRAENDGSELVLQYRLLMAAIEIHASGAIALWPDDPENDLSAAKLGQIQALLFKDFREILTEGVAPEGH